MMTKKMNTFDFLLRKDGRRGLVGWPSLFGMIDVAGSMLKYRNWDFRYPYGMVRYSPKKLYATGYEHAIGIENSQSKALGRSAPHCFFPNRCKSQFDRADSYGDEARQITKAQLAPTETHVGHVLSYPLLLCMMWVPSNKDGA
jgi:hypothetical protein